MGAHRRDRDGRLPVRAIEIFTGSVCFTGVIFMAIVMVWIIIHDPQNSFLIVLLVVCLGLLVPKLAFDSVKIILGK